MLGYFLWKPEGRPRVDVTVRRVGAARFCCVTAQGTARRVERRVLRTVKKLHGQGLRRCVTAPGWPDAWRGDVRLLDDLALRRALLPQLLDKLCAQRSVDLTGGATLLSAPALSPEVQQAAELLARRSRYLILALPDAAPLQRFLWQRYGLSAGQETGRYPAVQVCFDMPCCPAPALLLGPEGARRQSVRYALPGAWEQRLAPWSVTPELVSALWAGGALQTKEIRVDGLGTNA